MNIENFKDFIISVFSIYSDILYCILGFLLVVFFSNLSKLYSDSFRKFHHLDIYDEETNTQNKVPDIYIDKDGNWIEVFRD